VTVIEAADAVGGKLRSKPRDGFLVDQGAFFIPTTHRRMVALAAEAGFADQITAGGSIMAAARGDKIHQVDINHVLRDFARTDLFSFRSKLAMTPLIGEFWRSRRASFDRLPELGGLDGESAEAWARRELGDEMAEYVVDLVLRGMSAARAQTASRVEMLTVLALLGGARMVACQGGMGAYAANLASGMDVALNAVVREVRPDGEGVRVTWRDQSGAERVEHAAGCVVAGSTETALSILPELDPWRKAFLGRARDTRMFILTIGLSRQPRDLPATYVLVPRSVHPFLCGICSDHHKAPGRVPAGKGLLTLMPLASWGEQHYGDDDDKIARMALEAVDSLIPGVSNDVEFVEVTRWNQRYNPIGHYGDLGRFREECARADPRIQLAGDYCGYPQLETAIRSGETAADALVKALGLSVVALH